MGLFDSSSSSWRARSWRLRLFRPWRRRPRARRTSDAGRSSTSRPTSSTPASSSPPSTPCPRRRCCGFRRPTMAGRAATRSAPGMRGPVVWFRAGRAILASKSSIRSRTSAPTSNLICTSSMWGFLLFLFPSSSGCLLLVFYGELCFSMVKNDLWLWSVLVLFMSYRRPGQWIWRFILKLTTKQVIRIVLFLFFGCQISSDREILFILMRVTHCWCGYSKWQWKIRRYE